MLEGITVLDQSAAMDYEPLPFVTALLIIAIAGIFIAAWLEADWMIAVVLILGGLFISIPISVHESEDRYRYECLIDESVSMKDVYERYEIIEQRGDIWVLEDKE
jgi:hypothetical protein